MNTEVVSKALFDKMSQTAERALNIAGELAEQVKVQNLQIERLSREIERLKEENSALHQHNDKLTLDNAKNNYRVVQ